MCEEFEDVEKWGVCVFDVEVETNTESGKDQNSENSEKTTWAGCVFSAVVKFISFVLTASWFFFLFLFAVLMRRRIVSMGNIVGFLWCSILPSIVSSSNAISAHVSNLCFKYMENQMSGYKSRIEGVIYKTWKYYFTLKLRRLRSSNLQD